MADYNFHFNLQGNVASNDASNDTSASQFAPFAPVMGQSADWFAPDYPSEGLIGGGLAAQPFPELDSAHFVAAGSGGTRFSPPPQRAKNYYPDVSQHFHSNQQHTIVTFPSEHTCASNDCNTSFQTASDLQQHALDEEHQAFLCTCGEGYTRPYTLNRHIKEAKEPRRYECPCCDNPPAFKRPGHVEQHLRSKHQVSKKATIDALMKLHQAVSRQGLPRRKAAGVVTAVSPVSAAVGSSSSAPLPVQPLPGLSPLSIGGFHRVNMSAPFSVPAAGFAAAPFPAPFMGYSDAGFAATSAAEAAVGFAGDDVLGGLGLMDDGMGFADFVF